MTGYFNDLRMKIWHEYKEFRQIDKNFIIDDFIEYCVDVIVNDVDYRMLVVKYREHEVIDLFFEYSNIIDDIPFSIWVKSIKEVTQVLIREVLEDISKKDVWNGEY